MTDINAWLASLGLERYAEAFADNDIDLEVLSELDENDLESLGLSLGHRKKLLKAMKSLAIETVAAPEAAPSGERRQVTVVFVDLSGFTKLSNTADPEEIHTILNGFFETTDAIIEDFGGTIDKHIGDNVMAVFGAPVAHDDDPMRAVRAALAVHAAMPAMSEAAGHELAVHIGIASGEVVASRTGSEAHAEYTVTGNSVNLAARLDDMAGPGDTFISDAVHHTVSRLVECDAVGDTAIKGIEALVKVWRIRSLKTQDAEGSGLPFVGRAADRRQFASAVDACRETGCGQVIHVRGEAGIGKSRLVGEFRAAADAAGFSCHSGLILDFGVGKGQDAIGAIVRGLLGMTQADGVDARQAGAQQALDDGLLTVNDAVFLNDLLELPQPTEARGLYDAMDHDARDRGKRACLGRLVTNVAAGTRLLLTVEDIHWADAATMAQVAALAKASAACPVLLVMTSRIEGDPIDQAWRAATGGAPIITMDLGPLRQAEAMELAGGIVAAGHRLQSSVIDRAEGNPLFLEQLLYNAEAEQDTSIPGSIQSLMLARMDRLGAVDRHALQAASIIGQRFAVETLRHLIEDPTFECDELVSHNLIRPVAEDMLFAHALIRDVAYSTMLSASKNALHRRAADWFQHRDPVLHAEHLDRAADPGAAKAYLAASRLEAEAFRHERALGLVERGLELAGGNGFALAVQRGELLVRLGRSKESIAAYHDAQALARTETEQCQALIGVAAGSRLLGGSAEGIEALDQAEPLARKLNLDLERAQIHFYRGTFAFAESDMAGCLEQQQQALDYAGRAGDHEWQARALSGLGDANYAAGRMGTAMEYFRDCIALTRTHGLGRIEIANRFVFGVTRRYVNEIEDALLDIRAAIDMAEKAGDKRVLVYALTLQGEFLTDACDPAAAEASLTKAMENIESLGNRRFSAYVMNHQARQLLLAGRRAEAHKRIAQAYEVSRETGPTFIGPRILGTKALIASNAPERTAALVEGEALLAQGCISHNHLWFYRDAIDASLDMAAWDEATRYADALEAYTQDEPLPWADLFIARGRALVAWGRGIRDDATRAAMESIRDEARRIGLIAPVATLEDALNQAG
jgi:class 3 adenylate cyclase/predicted ATPase